jgi:tryptophanyl-tRNA synthetase
MMNDKQGGRQRVLSGVQPSGLLHIGNYFGAIRQHIELQDAYAGEAFYFIADYHALTTTQDRELLRKQTLDVALDYLALGLDPAKATFYRQSDVPQVTELMWVLSCVAGIGELERATSYKDKVDQGLRATVGLFLYPVLMAADILGPRSTIVPVGQDQVQHLEITRAIARSFNSTFKRNVFPEPQVKLNDAAIVPGLDGQKMSKSYDNTIPIFASDAELEAKVKRIKTDSTPKGQPLNPETDTVFALYRLVASGDDVAVMRRDYREGAIGYGDAKMRLLDALNAYFGPFRQRRTELDADAAYVDGVLRAGAERAGREIGETMRMVRDAVGLTRDIGHRT